MADSPNPLAISQRFCLLFRKVTRLDGWVSGLDQSSVPRCKLFWKSSTFNSVKPFFRKWNKLQKLDVCTMIGGKPVPGMVQSLYFQSVGGFTWPNCPWPHWCPCFRGYVYVGRPSTLGADKFGSLCQDPFVVPILETNAKQKCEFSIICKL